MPPINTPTEIDKISYDAPLSFTEPSNTWTEAKGGRKNNRTDKLVYGRDVPVVDLTDRWILISGANSGIGREAAITFASWGANLVLACREPGSKSKEPHPSVVVEECRSAAKANGKVSEIEWWIVDMTDLKSVEALGERWLNTQRPLDVLCNNAGVGSSPGGDGGREGVALTKDGFEFIHQVCRLTSYMQ